MDRLIAIALFSMMLAATQNARSAEQAESSDEGVPAELKEHCATHPCRQNVRINLRTAGDSLDVHLPLYWPVVQKNHISILPGEKLHIEAMIEDGHVTQLKHVEQVVDPEKTLVLEFTQMKDDFGMNLVVKNPFEKFLKFHIDMIDFARESHQTSSCPAVPGGMLFENWPHPIPELIISDMRFLEEGEEIACVY